MEFPLSYLTYPFLSSCLLISCLDVFEHLLIKVLLPTSGIQSHEVLFFFSFSLVKHVQGHLPLCKGLLFSHSVVSSSFATPWTVCSLPGSSIHWILSKNTGVGCHFFFQGIFLTQGSNLGLSHCRQILYLLSHQGSLINTLLVFNFRI